MNLICISRRTRGIVLGVLLAAALPFVTESSRASSGGKVGAYLLVNYPYGGYGNVSDFTGDPPPPFVKKGAIFDHLARLIHKTPSDGRIHLINMIWDPKIMKDARATTHIHRLYGAILRKARRINMIVSMDRNDLSGGYCKKIGRMRNFYDYAMQITQDKPLSWYFANRATDKEHSDKALLHAKVALFSETEIRGVKVRNVVCVTSSNFHANALRKMQDMVCVFGSERLHKTIKSYFWAGDDRPHKHFGRQHIRDLHPIPRLRHSCINFQKPTYPKFKATMPGPNLPYKIAWYNRKDDEPDGIDGINHRPFGVYMGWKKPGSLGVKNLPKWLIGKLGGHCPTRMGMLFAQNDKSLRNWYSNFAKKRCDGNKDAMVHYIPMAAKFSGDSVKFVTNSNPYSGKYIRIQPVVYSHMKTVIMKRPGSRFVLMGSRNGKDVRTSDMNLMIQDRPGTADLWDQYERLFDWLDLMKNDPRLKVK